MDTTDLTIEVLKDIRAEMRDMRTEMRENVRDVRSEVASTNERLDALTRRVVEGDIRTATALTDLAGAVQEMTSFLRGANELRPRVERCEEEIASLKRRLP